VRLSSKYVLFIVEGIASSYLDRHSPGRPSLQRHRDQLQKRCALSIQQDISLTFRYHTFHQDERSYDRRSEESIYSERSATSEHGVVSPSTGCTVETHGDNVRIGRNRDFRIDHIGASNCPGPFLDIPKPAQSPTVVSPPRAINAPVPCTPPAVLDSPRCRPNVTLDRRSTSTSLHPRRRRLVIQIPQSIAEADESTVVDENADVSPYKEKEEVQVQDSTDDVTGVVFTVLQALQEDSTERLTPTFVYESDEDSCESFHSPSPAPSPAASSLFDEIPDSLTPVTTPPSSFAEKSRSSASYISPGEDNCEEEVDIAPISLTHGSVKPFVQIHRRTNAVDIRCLEELDQLGRKQYLEGPLEMPRTSDIPRPADTKWAAVDEMIVVKVFVPATDDIWRIRVPQDISLQRFTSKVLSKLGFHVAFSASCFDGPEYYFRTNDAFRRWIENRVRNGRNLPIVAHVIDAPPLSLHVVTSPFSSVRPSPCIANDT